MPENPDQHGGGLRHDRALGDLRVTRQASFPWQLDGYRQALARFERVAYQDVEPAETYIPLFETLSWAATIALRLGKGNKPDLLRALEFARNAVHHDWADALRLEPRRYGEGAYGEGEYGGHVWRWAPTDELPNRKPDRDREPFYRTLLEGQAALDTLRLLADALDG